MKRVLSHDPETGITETFVSGEGDSWHIISSQDAEPIIEHNKRLQRTPEKWRGDLRIEASIPLTLLLKWAVDDGVPPSMVFSDEYAGKIMRRLNDPDYRFLKTADVRV